MKEALENYKHIKNIVIKHFTVILYYAKRIECAASHWEWLNKYDCLWSLLAPWPVEDLKRYIVSGMEGVKFHVLSFFRNKENGLWTMDR